jgi:hypothetical protein
MSILGATTSASAQQRARWPEGLHSRAREYGYALAVALAALAATVLVGGTAPSSNEVYAPLALALIVGLLLTVRLAPGRAPAAMVLIPAMVFDARFGVAALPAV